MKRSNRVLTLPLALVQGRALTLLALTAMAFALAGAARAEAVADLFAPEPDCVQVTSAAVGGAAAQEVLPPKIFAPVQATPRGSVQCGSCSLPPCRYAQEGMACTFFGRTGNCFASGKLCGGQIPHCGCG